MSKQMGRLRLWLHRSLCDIILAMQKFLGCFKESLSCSISTYCLKAMMLFGCIFCNAEPICIECTEDYTILDRFFRMTFSEEEYGYVLEGAKPISLRNFMALGDFPISKDFKQEEKEFNNTLLVHQAIPIWNKLCSHQDHFVLKVVALSGQVSPLLSTLELSFINIPKLKEVIDKNIDLFHYILGPSNTVQDIVDSIVHSDQPLVNNLKYDLSLVGIVLGFGSHNSIVGGRLETILALSISKDHPPFTPQSYLMQGKAEHSLDFLTPDRYGTYYLELAGGDDAYFRVDLPRLEKHSSYANLEEEVQSIDKLVEPLPQSLWKLPRFVFGAFKGGPSNQPFFKHLQKTQIKIRALLKKSDFLEYILEPVFTV